MDRDRFPGSKLSRGVVLPLKKLVDSGTIILTEDEFAAQKAKILGS